MSFSSLPTAWLIAFGLVLGLLVGSFLNVVILRLPKWMLSSWRRECEEFLKENKNNPHTQESSKFNIAFPASHCPKCKAPIKAWQNIPLISFIFLKGKCASCEVKISVRYPIIELVSGLLTAFALYTFSFTPEAALAIIFSWSLICLTMIDADHQLLPDDICLPLLWLGLAANSFALFTSLESAVYGAIFGYLSLWSVYWLFKLLTKKEGMGYGDFKLLAALGAWMGAKSLILIIILSAFVGAFVGIAGILIMGKDRSKPIPFGPFLATAGLVAFYWGDTLLTKYLQLMGIPQG